MNDNKSGYIHVEPLLGDYIHGDGKLGTVSLQSDGQWGAFLPPDNLQTNGEPGNLFDPFDCVTQATLACVEILERQEYGDTTDWGRRFLATISGTGEKHGNDPQTVSQALKNNGCVYATEYPFHVADFATFYQAITQKLKTLAIAEFSKYAYGHSWVNANPADMMAALTYSPLSAAGYAWKLDPQTGYYISPPGTIAGHDFVVYGYQEGACWLIWDSYNPTKKKLAWDYTFTGIKRHTLHKQVVNTVVAESAWTRFLDLIRKICGFAPTFGAVRSPKWNEIRKSFLALHPACAVCGKNGTLLKPNEAHHKRPFHLHPELELLSSNLITLCRDHHFLFGHLTNWSSFNVDVETDAKIWSSKIKSRP